MEAGRPWILSTKEAGLLIRMSPNKLRVLAEAGEVPAFRVGKNWRYRREDLVDWVSRQVAASAEGQGGADAEV
jgi:excisionase family DNA binding protein